MSNANNSRKRPREETRQVQCSPQDMHPVSWHAQKRLNLDESEFQKIQDTSSRPTVSVLHHVQCGKKASGHNRHAQSTMYQDVPRLFKGDSRASALRGKLSIHGPERSIESSGNGNLIVVRLYDCERFHRDVEDRFTRTPSPCLDPPIPEEFWPYFDVLDDDTEIAKSKSDEIHISKQLRRTMEALADTKPNPLSGWEEELRPPYIQIYHARSFIRSRLHEGHNEDQSRHAIQLVNYVEDTFGPSYAEAEMLFSQGLVKKSHMSMLFRPDEVVVSFDEEKPRGFATCGSLITSKVPWELPCFSWEFDGSFTKQEKVFKLEWPPNEEGPLNIEGLSMYPLRFDRTGKFKSALRESGEKVWSCRMRRFVAYNAPTSQFEIRASNPRYMIDMEMYKTLHSDDDKQEDSPKSTQTLAYEILCRDEPPCDNFLLLLPPTLLGFGMHDKKWRTLKVEHISAIEWNKNAFEQLVLDYNHKELIEAVIRGHVSSDMSPDIVEGKGKGVMILLHGGPGTGKTLTAESVAELAERPLYRVSCGDIGTDPEKVETYLDSVLHIGQMWQAVVLLDESDVFLEEREKMDLKRNALVSVFLRALEYYEGILILTSNRVGHFDEAFKSRMQLTLHYPPINVEGRKQIWDNFIHLLEQREQRIEASPESHCPDGERVNIAMLKARRDALADVELNGRQIRNVISTARQLARLRNKAMGFEHLQATIKTVSAFEKYVEQTHGHSAAEYARSTQSRLE